jgi:hypothetical protein
VGISLAAWQLLLGLLLALLIVVHVATRAFRALRRQAALADAVGGERLGWAGYFIPPPGGAAHGRGALRPGALWRDGLQLRFTSLATPTAAELQLAWPIGGVRMRRLRTDPLALGLPDLIRLVSEGEVHFLAGTSPYGAPSAAATRRLFDRLRQTLPPLPEAAVDAAPRPPGQRLLGAVVVLALVACIGLLVHARLQQGEVLGVQAMAVAADDGLLAATGRELLRFSAAGELQEAIAWRELGLSAGVGDVAALSDGRVLLGDVARGVIVRCGLAVRRCEELPAFGQGGEAFRRAFRFVVDEARGAIYASDTSRHRAVRIGLDGRWDAIEQAAGRGLCFPNRPALGRDGRLLWPDTNNFRVLEWPDAGRWPDGELVEHAMVAARPRYYGCRPRDRTERGGDAFLERMLDFQALGHARAFPGLTPGSVWASDLMQAPDGRWWVLLNGANMRRGSVAVFTPDWRRPLPVELPPRADPWSMVLRRADVLVSDPVAHRIHRFALDGSPRGEFAAGALRARLEPLERRRLAWGRASLALGSLLVFAIIGLVAAGAWRRRLLLRKWAALPLD